MNDIYISTYIWMDLLDIKLSIKDRYKRVDNV